MDSSCSFLSYCTFYAFSHSSTSFFLSRPKQLPHDCVVEVVSEVIPEEEFEDNHTRLIHAANTASLAGFKRNFVKEITTVNEGNVEGSKKKRSNAFNDDENIILLNNNEENIKLKDNGDTRKEHSPNFTEDASSHELLKCKLKVSSSLSISSRRFDLSSAYRDLLCDQGNLRRSQGTFLRNDAPKRENFRRSKSCPRRVERGTKERERGKEKVDGNKFEYGRREKGRGTGRENFRYDNRDDDRRTGRSEEKDDRRDNGGESESSSGRYRSGKGIREESSERDRGRGRGILGGYESTENKNEIESENEGLHVDVAQELMMKRGRDRKIGNIFEKKAHVQYVRPASASVSKDFKLRNSTSSSTFLSIPSYTGNHYPLRTSSSTAASTSNRLLPGQNNATNLNDRNAFSMPYIIPEGQPYHQNALTNAVEKVVTDFFR